MLSTDRRDGRLRLADNLVPRAIGGGEVSLRTRPGAKQVVGGVVDRAIEWGGRVVFERDGRLWLWDDIERDLAPAGTSLDGAAFQAPTVDAQREERFYIADGVRPLWYITTAEPAPHSITNETKQSSGQPYPLAPARTVATWRDRLWYSWGTNRVAHSDVRNPSAFDPLWTQEAQGDSVSRVVALMPERDRLLLGGLDETFAVTGDSQYNFQTRPALPFGVAGPRAGDRLSEQETLLVSPQGVHLSQSGAAIGDDLRSFLEARWFGAEVAVDVGRRLALVCVGGRIFAANLDAPGLWGELAVEAFGVLRLESGVGWYGPDGIWLLAREGADDRCIDGTLRAVTASWETWWAAPDTDDAGNRLVLERTELLVRASRGSLTYTAFSPHDQCSATRDLASESRSVWANLPGAGHDWPDRAHTLEFTPHLDGEAFVHRIDVDGAVELLSFAPSYR